MAENKEYIDLSLSFERNPITGDVNKVEDDLSVKQSIKVLLLTHLNERPFQEGKGSVIKDMLFELRTPEIEMMLRQNIQQVLTNYEPRANIYEIRLFNSRTDENRIRVDIYFTVLNSLEINVVDIVLERVR